MAIVARVRISTFLWDDANMEHVAAHGVSPGEIEQLFWRIPRVRRSRLDRYVAVGQTEGGRHLFVVFRLFGAGVVRVITARDATPKERRSYGKK